VYTTFDPADIDSANFIGFGDIEGISSFNNGETWLGPVEVSNPDGQYPGCDDRYPSISPVNFSSALDPGHDAYIVYQYDNTAGSYLQGEEAANWDYFIFKGTDFPYSPLSLSVIPDSTFYSGGDTLGCTISLRNNINSTIFFQLWTEGEGPSGGVISPLYGPADWALGPNETVSLHLSQFIPEATPDGGPYIFRVKAGEYPNEVLAEDSFQFFVFSTEINLELSPDTTHFNKGDLLGFTATVINNKGQPVSFQGWTEGETPWGEVFSPLLGPMNWVIDPFDTLTQYLTQQIPQEIIYGGPYIYRGKVGEYPDRVFAEDFFEFFIVPPGSDPK
jgi:hypothetical protein